MFFKYKKGDEREQFFIFLAIAICKSECVLESFLMK